MYKTFQATGGAVAWRINALHCELSQLWYCYPQNKPTSLLSDRPITQLKINWVLFGSALVIALPTVLAITPSPAHDPVVVGGSGSEDEGPRKDSSHSD